MGQLTDLHIRKLQAASGKRVEIWDDRVPGLGVRASSETKAFVLLYRLNGKSKRMTLGRYPVLSLSEARELATTTLNKLAHGEDPQSDKDDCKLVYRVDEVVEEFVRMHCNRVNRAKTARETERLLRMHFLRPWSGRDIRSIKKPDVLAILDAIVEDGSPSTANHAFAAGRKMFNWSVGRGLVEVSPCTGIPNPAQIRSRSRVLTDAELAAVWRAADAVGPVYGPIIKLLILTAQRRTEVTELRWTEIDLEQALWSLAEDRTKNGRSHTVPLTPSACNVIASIPRLNEMLVFPARGRDDATFSGFSKLKRRIDELSGVTGWTLHDLRRTAATGMARIGVAPHVVERILNHTSGSLGGVAGIYNRFKYLPEMRAALLLWERHILTLAVSEQHFGARQIKTVDKDPVADLTSSG